MKDRRILIVLVSFMILSGIFMSSGFSSTYKNNTKIDINNAKMMNNQWMYKSQDIQLPTNVNAPVNTEVKINRYLPYIFVMPAAILRNCILLINRTSLFPVLPEKNDCEHR